MAGCDVVDDTLESIGGCGRFQILHIFIINITLHLAYIWQITVIIFTGFYNDHYCMVPANTTKDEWIPTITGTDGDLMHDKCHHFTEIGSSERVTCQHGWTYDPETFHPSTGTIVMEWDLVCTKSSLVEISIVCLSLGSFLGTLFSGPLGDRYGRRHSFFNFLIILIVSGIACAFSPDIVTFCVLSLIRGVGVSGVYTLGVVLSIEIIPKRVINWVIPMSSMLACVGMMLISLLAYLIPQWRYLQLAISIIPVIALPYFWWCPESFHWLYQNGRHEELDKAFVRVALVNRSPVASPVARPTADTVSASSSIKGARSCNQVVLDSSKQEPTLMVHYNSNNSNTISLTERVNVDATTNSSQAEEMSEISLAMACATMETINGASTGHAIMTRPNINHARVTGGGEGEGEIDSPLMDFVRRPRTLSYVIIVCYLSFVSYLAFFGISYMQGSLTGSIYLNVFLDGLSAIPGILGAMVLLRKYGRRPAEVGCFACMGVMLMLAGVAPYIPIPGIDRALLSMIFARLARTGESSSFAIFTFYSSELIPTNVRSTVAGLLTGFGYLGSIAAPFISLSLIRVQFWIPGVVYGVITIIAAGLTLLLPETRGRDLPKTAAEVEAWPKNLPQAEKLRLEEGRLHRKNSGIENRAAVFEDICASSYTENGSMSTYL